MKAMTMKLKERVLPKPQNFGLRARFQKVVKEKLMQGTTTIDEFKVKKRSNSR